MAGFLGRAEIIVMPAQRNNPNKAQPKAKAQAKAQALAAKLAGGPTVALGEMKQTIRRGLEGDFATTLQYEAEAQRVAGNSKDAMEGGIAFLQKRKPEFKGA